MDIAEKAQDMLKNRVKELELQEAMFKKQLNDMLSREKELEEEVSERKKTRT